MKLESESVKSNSFSVAFNFRKYEYGYEYCAVWQLGGRILGFLRAIQGAALMARITLIRLKA
jgi:hypothetical protein